jgi:hypothetical protein
VAAAGSDKQMSPEDAQTPRPEGPPEADKSMPVEFVYRIAWTRLLALRLRELRGSRRCRVLELALLLTTLTILGVLAVKEAGSSEPPPCSHYVLIGLVVGGGFLGALGLVYAFFLIGSWLRWKELGCEDDQMVVHLDQKQLTWTSAWKSSVLDLQTVDAVVEDAKAFRFHRGPACVGRLGKSEMPPETLPRIREILRRVPIKTNTLSPADQPPTHEV